MGPPVGSRSTMGSGKVATGARWRQRGGDRGEGATGDTDVVSGGLGVVVRAREDGCAGAAVHDVADAQHGMHLEAHKSIHAEIKI